MSEVECRRARALAAEEQLRALHALLDKLRDWMARFHDEISTDQVSTSLIVSATTLFNGVKVMF